MYANEDDFSKSWIQQETVNPGVQFSGVCRQQIVPKSAYEPEPAPGLNNVPPAMLSVTAVAPFSSRPFTWQYRMSPAATSMGNRIIGSAYDHNNFEYRIPPVLFHADK